MTGEPHKIQSHTIEGTPEHQLPKNKVHGDFVLRTVVLVLASRNRKDLHTVFIYNMHKKPVSSFLHINYHTA